jgi:FMN phosphatase YigB (HAD superfamily)
MGQSPADILFIDDLMTNVDGAKAVGYQAELCDRSITRLREILVPYGVL